MPSALAARLSTFRRLLSVRRPRDFRPARPVVLVTAVALAVTGGTLTATGASAAGGEFLSSFEQADPQPLESTPTDAPVNVTGAVPVPGSLTERITDVAATAENPPGEIALNLVDGNSASKWLAFETSATITYTLDAPATVVNYSLTSAGDWPTRDPSAFTVEGSTDGTTWVPVDAQTGVTFAGRQSTNPYPVPAPAAYSFYRLVVSANSGDVSTQLADWQIFETPTTTEPGTRPMTTEIGKGPLAGPTNKPGVGFSGTKALRYAGEHIADGAASATNTLFTDLDVPIGDDTELSYKIFPELGDDLQYPATYAAVDLVLDDGDRISADTAITDSHGGSIAAAQQGATKILYADQWNSVRVDLSRLAGRTVTDILLTYDNPGGTADTAVQGWVDDVRIAPAPPVADGSSRVEYVDTRRGTNSTGSFSRGNNIPATAVPNGFNFWVPMTNASSQSWIYDYQRGNNDVNLPTLQGLGISHEPSPWMGDRNQLAILPALGGTGAPDADLETRALEFDHANEIARPDLYSVLTSSGIAAEVTPTDHAAIMRFTFPDDTGRIIVDQVSGNDSDDIRSSLDIDGDRLSGWVEGGSGLSIGASRMFVIGQFDRTATEAGTAAGDRDAARYASFDTSSDAPLELRIASSFISLDQAQRNLDLEVTGRSFDEVHNAAERQWNERLAVLDVEGATSDQLTTTYSSLYRLNLYPNSQFENTGTADAPVYRYASPVADPIGDATDTTTNAPLRDGKIYVNNGFWDTYRTVWPAYSLLYPDIADDLIDGFVQQYRDGGWVARWSSPGYADLMTGTSSDVSFADAYVKDVGIENALDTYDASLKNATVLPPSNAVGRKGLDQSIFLGYTAENAPESVSWGLEGYINDYGIGQMAARLADDPNTPADRVEQLREESTYFLERAQHYTYLFDGEAGFFKPRNADGSWETPAAEYDPSEWGNGYTETDGWNFAFHVPFDGPGLASLYGGHQGLVDKLDAFYATPETGQNVGSYGGVIHEMTEARDTRIGQLGMSNQVSHHIPYMSALAGDPATTQETVREITRRLFVGSDIGQGYPGDEDNGETSSWFLFSALGFYPLQMGSGQYELGSPLFTKATVHLGSGRDLVVSAPDNSRENIYVQSASFDGEPLDGTSISHDVLTEGGELRFDMGSTPSDFGATAPADVDTAVHDVDATRGVGSTESSDGTDVSRLVDDNSRSAVTFAGADPQLTWTSAQGPVTVTSYTVTNAAEGESPTSWSLEGSADGENWMPVDERTGEQFRWGTQTRPFQIESPSAFAHYRLSITDGSTPTLAELELLADPAAAPSEFALYAASGVTAEVGAELTDPIATLTGPGQAEDYDVTVDFRDGSAAQPATLTRTELGGFAVTAPHTFDAVGRYDVLVTAMDGTGMVSTTTPVDVARTAPSLVGAFDNVCLAEPGQAGNCDYLGSALARPSLAENGFVQGTTVAVPGTELTFDLPDIEPGQPDNATGNGQVIPLDLGDDVTQLSVIGTANETAQDTVGVLAFDDGTTMDLPIQFGDWTASVTAPAFGNILVAVSDYRMSGAAVGDQTDASVFSTAPVTLPAGRTAVSLTMPTQTGDPRASGRIHVFAIATDGTRLQPAALEVVATSLAGVVEDVEFTAPLGTVSGGRPADGYSATVNWGDGTATEDADVTDAAAPAALGVAAAAASTITGTHTYAEPGTYTVTVAVDDGSGSAITTSTVEVAAAPTYAPTISTDAGAGVAPGATVTVSGAGFAASESVTVTLSSNPVVAATVTTDAAGAFSAPVVVPAGAPDGTYPVSAIGDVSATSASTSIVVASGTPPVTYMPELRVLAGSALRGDVVGFDGSGFAPGETVTLTLAPDGIALGTAVANPDGVIAGQFTVPDAAATGAHRIDALGPVSSVATSVAFEVTDERAPDGGTAPATPGHYQGILPRTGGTAESVAWPALGGALLLVVGLGALLTGAAARRRRVRSSH